MSLAELIGAHGRVRVILRTPRGRLISDRVFANIETQYALNSIAAWIAGGGGVIAPTAPKYLAFGVGPVNLLTADQADFEMTIDGWQALSNCSLSQSGTEAWHGVYSLALTASSAASMSATTTPGASGIAVTAGYQYAACAHFHAASSSRQVGVNIAWYDSSGNPLSTSTGTTSADSTVGWTRIGVLATAPVGAAYAAMQLAVTSPGNGEVHYADGIQFAYAPDGPYQWAAGGLSSTTMVTDTALFQERYLTRAQIDSAYTNAALAAMLHTYQQTDPAGSFSEAGLWDQPVNSAGYLSLSTVAGATSILLGGSPPAVAAGTQIYIPPAPLAPPSAPTFSAASGSGGHLAGATTYYYKVTALDAYGESLPGAEATYNAGSTTNTNKITLTWNAVPGAVGYNVYRGTVSNGEQLLATLNPQTTTSYVDSSNTTPSGTPPTVDTSGSTGEYATIAAAAAAGASSWTLTDALLYPHSAQLTIGTTVLDAPVYAFIGNLWAHVALTGVSKTGTNLLTLQWQVAVANAF